ncbi:MAG TPA: fumarylacetoacetate hydrolase family protein [Dehalococcoidia bacterium]|nr:fumarylacetoacetate hydrolase family protein [Dehalococcoidia bacterium]
MRLVTYEDANGRHVGAVIEGDRVVDLGSVAQDMIELIEQGDAGLERARQAVQSGGSNAVPLSVVKLLAPIPRPRKNVFCVGLNYADHVAEGARARGTEVKLPEVPVYFTKAPTAVNHPGDDIPIFDGVSDKIDWEVELGVIIGRAGINIPEDRAMDYIYGYTVINDVSARDLQRAHGGQFFKGKTLDGSCPIGPWIVTRDEVADPHSLRITLRVNGVTKQDSNTKYFIFNLPKLISTLSAGMTIEGGDIIATGTPDGVGFARTPPEFLKPGDQVEAEVEGIGILRNGVKLVQRDLVEARTR